MIRWFRGMAPAHAAANALLLGLGYYWLGIGESRAATLAWSILIALAILAIASSTYGAAFAGGWRTALRNILPLMLFAVAVIVIYAQLERLQDYIVKPATQTASYLTLKLRKPVRPSTVLRVFNAALWLIRWVVLPVLLLPIVSAIAKRGWFGWIAFDSMFSNWKYWIAVPLLLLGGIWLPLKLLAWVPNAASFAMQMTSFGLRALIAYLLFVAAGLLLGWMTSGGNPRLTQPNTAASP